MHKKKISVATAPKGATPFKLTSATDWQMAARRDNVLLLLLLLLLFYTLKTTF